MDNHRYLSGELVRVSAQFTVVIAIYTFDSLVPLPAMIIGCAIRWWAFPEAWWASTALPCSSCSPIHFSWFCGQCPWTSWSLVWVFALSSQNIHCFTSFDIPLFCYFLCFAAACGTGPQWPLEWRLSPLHCKHRPTSTGSSCPRANNLIANLHSKHQTREFYRCTISELCG